MMEDCHQRIRFFLKTLTRIANAPGEGQLDPELEEALGKALTYFREAAPRHTADEEQSLFPRLRHLNDPLVSSMESTLQCLEQEHAHADAAQKQIDDLAGRWLDGGSLTKFERGKLRSSIKELSAHYEQHMAVEEQIVFTLAKKILSASEQQEIGREMAGRRRAIFSGNRDLGHAIGD
jgi:hemerythrin-like domain-containing protein